MDIVTLNETETIDFAKKIAKTLTAGDVALLSGTLGAGKSVFCRAVIRALCGDESMDVPSPTYTLVQVYEGACPVWHFDLYRLNDPSEIFETGWEEAQNQGIVLVEWPERLGPLLPRPAVTIRLTPIPGFPDRRHIEVLTDDDRFSGSA